MGLLGLAWVELRCANLNGKGSVIYRGKDPEKVLHCLVVRAVEKE